MIFEVVFEFKSFEANVTGIRSARVAANQFHVPLEVVLSGEEVATVRTLINLL